MGAPAAQEEGGGEPPSDEGAAADQSASGGARRPSVTDRVRRKSIGHAGVDFGAMILAANHFRAASERYEIGGKLGDGGFASVYRAKGRESGQVRAMKVIQKSAHAESMELLAAELCALIQLEHPNIVTFYEFFEQDTSICLIFELCALGDYGQVHWKTESEETVRLRFRDVMLGVAYCHAQEVAHRDLKFDNCLLTESGGRTVGKIVDFGLAHIKRPSEAKLVMHDRCGTAPFMAPEVIGGSDYGLQCDIWSFGVMLYVASTMEHPILGDVSKLSTDDMFRMITTCHVRARPMEALDKSLVCLLSRLLVKEPEKRIGAADALEDAWLLGVLSEPRDSRDCSMMWSWLGCGTRSPQDGDGATDKGSVRRPPSVLSTPSRSDSAAIEANLGSFSKLTKFEKTVTMLAAHQQDSELHEEGLKLFMVIDKDNSGEIGFEEFRKGLEDLGIRVEEADMKIWFETVDSNNSGSINYREWLMLMFPPDLLESQEAVRSLFVFFDSDDNGCISREELCAVIGEVEADSVMSRGDISGDGSLDFEEFREVIVDIARRRAQALSATSPCAPH